MMQLFLKTLYWRSLASIALVVLDSLMMCFSSSAGGMLWSVENLLNLVQQLGSNEGLLRAFKKCGQPFRLGLVSSISGGKKGAKLPWNCGDLRILCLSLEVPNCTRVGEIFCQVAKGSLVKSSDLGRMFKFWSVIRFNGTYL